MKIAILSDLHLKDPKSSLSLAFEEILMKFQQDAIEELWLLGDIFDLLIGRFAFWNSEYASVFQRLKKLRESGCRITWLEGNHDFHLRALLEPLGIEVVDGEIQRQVAGKKVFLAHGDLVNSDDKKYLRWRAFTREPKFRQVLDWAPDILAKKLLWPFARSLSRSSRKQSRRHDQAELAEIQHRYRSFALQKFSAGFDAVFLGHCHVEDLWRVDGKFYCNLGSGLDGTVHYALWNPATESFPKVEFHSKMKA